MELLNRREPIILFVGDLLAFSLALWLSLIFRYGEIPSMDLCIDALAVRITLPSLDLRLLYCRTLRKTHPRF